MAALTMKSEICGAILQSSSDAIIATDKSGVVTFWNPGAARMFGFTEEEAAGKSIDLIIPETLRARHWEGYHRAMATGGSKYGDGDLLAVPAITKDGRRISVEFTIVMMRNRELQISGIVAVMRDVSARFEEMRQLRRELAENKPSGSPR